MCIDYSIGSSLLQRKTGNHFGASLAALRWPHPQLVLHDGRTMNLPLA